jgi:hypothetical protein
VVAVGGCFPRRDDAGRKGDRAPRALAGDRRLSGGAPPCPAAPVGRLYSGALPLTAIYYRHD